MSPCPPDELLARFLEGSASEGEALLLEAHLDACAGCRRLVGGFARCFAPPAPSPPARQLLEGLAAGARVGRYEVRRPLGAGGLGDVYAAFDPALGREVALKLLRTEPLADEARAMAQLSHPNVIPVYDVGVEQGQAWLAMELVDGAPLSAWLEGAPAREEILAAFRGAGAGLAAIHRAGLTHGDFKPQNVLITGGGVPRVGDFGMAVRIGGAPRGGTDAYMSPEQRLGAPADPRADQFSFCVALHEALTGERLAADAKVTRLPARLARALERGVRQAPSLRFPSLELLLAALAPSRRRRALAIAGAGLLALAVPLGAAARLPPFRCAGLAGELAGVWDGPVRERLRVAFLATRSPYAAQAWAGVERELSSRAGAWLEARRRSCEAGATAAPQRACLERLRRELTGAGRALAAADEQTVLEAARVVEGLGRASDCEGPRAVPPAEGSAPLAEQLEEARALHRAGKYTAAAALGAQVAEAAHGRLRAEALLARGAMEQSAGRVSEGRATYEAALVEATRLGADPLALEALSGLVRASGHLQSDFPAAERYAALARATSARYDPAPAERARLASALGAAAMARGDFAQARVELEGALALVEKALGPQAVPTADAHLELSRVLDEAGEDAQALSHVRAALAVLEPVRGPRHPEVGRLLLHEGSLQTALGEAEAAVGTLTRALEILVAALSPDHPNLGFAHHLLGNAYLAQADGPAAQRELEAALRIRERALAPDDPQLAKTLKSLASAHALQGRHAEAEALARRSLRLLEAKLGPTHPTLGFTLDALGEILLALHRPADALREFQRAVAVREPAVGERSPVLGWSLVGMGKAELTLGNPVPARASLERACALLRPESLDRAEAELWLAKALWGQGGDRRRALALARGARERFAAAGGAATAQRKDAEQWLALHLAEPPKL